MKRLIWLLLILTIPLVAQKQGYFQQDVEYKIDVTLDVPSKTYHGSQKLTYTNNSPDELSFIWMHLYPNAYKNETSPFARQEKALGRDDFYFSDEAERGYLDLEEVKTAGVDLEWELKEDAIDEAKLYLPEPLKPGESIEIDLVFKGKSPAVFSRSGHWGNSYFHFTQWYPKVVVYDKYGWHPDSYYDVGEFYGEFGTFDVSITLPENFVIEATGELQDNPAEKAFNDSIIAGTQKLLEISDEEQRANYIARWRKESRKNTDYAKTKTVRFIAKNVHDFAWFVGEDYMIHQKVTEDGVLAKACVLPANGYDWKDTPEYIAKSLWFFGERVGKYKWPKAVVIDGTQETFGGMEYPMITLIAIDYASWHNLLEGVIAHEVGHNWFQGMLGSNERASVFLDEGLTNYHDHLYMEHYYGRYNTTKFDSLLGPLNVLDDIGQWHLDYLQYSQMVLQHTIQPMSTRGEKFTPQSYSAANYAKAYFMLGSLEWMMGKHVFVKAMHTYFERWHFRHPELDDFWQVMEEVSGMDLAKFRHEWMETTHYADFSIENYETEKTAEGYKTTVFVSDNGTMRGLPAPVHLVTQSGDTLEGRWSGNEDEPVVFEHQQSLKKVGVNLNYLFYESDYLNNAGLPDFEFTFLRPMPSFEKYKVVFFPYVGYEYFEDKMRLGGGFWGGNPILKHYFTKGSVYYGLGSSAIGYSLAFEHRLPGFIANFSDFNVGIYDKDGLKRISTGLKTTIRSAESFRFRSRVGVELATVKLHDMVYHEPGIYQRSRYTTAKIKYEGRWRYMLWKSDLDISLEKSIDAFNSTADFTKFEYAQNLPVDLARNIVATLDVYAASVSGDAIPSQEMIFAGGGVDPKHEEFVPAYRGSAGPLRHFSMNEGMKMLGYSSYRRTYLKNNAGFAAGLEFDLPLVPKVYGRVGSLAATLDEIPDARFFAETGVKLGGEAFQLIFPVYISDPFPGEDRLDFRFFYSFELPLDL